MDIALAEEIERAVAGASIESRARAIGKLRARVKEQAADDATDWSLVQSTEVNKVSISIYQRKRPRGDFNNVKMTGTTTFVWLHNRGFERLKVVVTFVWLAATFASLDDQVLSFQNDLNLIYYNFVMGSCLW